MEGFIPWPDEFARKYLEEGYWLDKTISEVMDESFRRYSKRTALISNEGREFTYSELGNLVTRLALHLKSLGLKLYDRGVLQKTGGEVPQGQVGELTIRGYYRAAEHNAMAFTADGFYKSGDLIRLHPSGNVIVEGRIKDTINRGGEKISAEEVENHILSHPDVDNCAYVAMPDPLLGEKACAYVLLQPGKKMNSDSLNEFLLTERKIAKFKLPERLELMDALGLCFLHGAAGDIELEADALRAASGFEIDVGELFRVGLRFTNLMRLYTVRCGFQAEDDALSPRYLSSPARGINTGKSLADHLPEMRKKYYRLMGWDDDGVPLPETLKELGIE